MTSPHKLVSQFHPNFTGMFLWWSSLKNYSKNLIPCRSLVAMATKRKNQICPNKSPKVKLARPRRFYFPYMSIVKTKKNLL
jgi:hypothetical protein